MMLAAAMDAGWLEAGCPHGLASLSVQRILVVVNGCDPVLKWYPRLYGRGGRRPWATSDRRARRGKLEVVDVSCQVGKKHDFDRYEGASSVLQRLAWYTFLCEPVATAAKWSINPLPSPIIARLVSDYNRGVLFPGLRPGLS